MRPTTVNGPTTDRHLPTLRTPRTAPSPPTFHFCPVCGSTVYWEGEGFPGYVAVAIGTFADSTFPAPSIAVWEEARHPWVTLPPDTPPKRVPKQG
jgi:hypothetical protein